MFDNLENILKTMPNSEKIRVGKGVVSPETIERALKRCAPLAQWGWSIYLLRLGHDFEYGLLRCGLHALSLTAPELLIEHGDKSLPAILIRHISQHTIELSGAGQNSLRIHFGPVEAPDADPVQATRRFCDALTRDAPIEIRDQLTNFYRRVFAGVLRSGHGCLAAARSTDGKKVLAQFKDGVAVTPFLDVSARVANLLKNNSCESDVCLRATAALIKGMLNTDGITVFSSRGDVEAYNVFVKHPKKSTDTAPTFGGARKRAFETLCSWVGKDLRGAFFLSQDGHAEFRGV